MPGTSFSRSRKIRLETKSLGLPMHVRDQGDQAFCCASMAVVTCMEILDAQDGAYVELSPLYNYYKARGYGSVKTKLSLQDAISSAINDGVAPREFHDTPAPVTIEAARRIPSGEADREALKYQIVYSNWGDYGSRYGYYELSYSTSRAVEEWKEALRKNHPIAIGVLVGEAYDQLNETYAVYRPEPENLSLSRGHAVAVVGMDESMQAFKVLDSRGNEFADKGCWWLPYSVISQGVVVEAVAIDRITYEHI
ncbi:hypothetical protein [Desulfovibrio sp. JC022]|uniref:hypothetical protein n=1 Tax=Desulfovibrio sp. JC022 TaxID=2593642 RepID=UPI0013D05E04|nr:hypothetical protein [Desulfovibrio sp. JC022]NDV22055.1 hypothetical protein [Desulfovibrio sp. JC022]